MKTKLAFVFLVLVSSVAETVGCCGEDSVAIQTTRSRRSFRPHFASAQFAGNTGWLSIAIGYTNKTDRFSFALLYGYTPEKFGGTRIHSINSRNVVHLYRHSLSKKHTIIPYAGLTASLEVGGNSFFFQPAVMPKSYYDFPKSIHAIAFGGIKLRQMTPTLLCFHGFEFFAEASTVDAYVWYKFLSEEVRVHDIFTLSIGVNLLR